MFILAIASLILWLLVFILPWTPWLTREQWDLNSPSETGPLNDVTVLIPARNEEQVIARTLSAVLAEGSDLKVILIDDHSSDQTVSEAFGVGGDHLRILPGKPLPPGWSGKLWSLEQGRLAASTPILVFLDADILIKPGLVNGLKKRLVTENRPFISLLAKPSLETFWERLLMPAFVYFFKLLYPFRLVNAKSNYVAAAAGGCIMVKAEVIDKIGGFSSFRSALIDDCQLARKVKNAGYPIWLGLTRSMKSIRPYQGLMDIWNMVARTAYTQLHYSWLLLLVCSLVMILAFAVPVSATLSLLPNYSLVGALAWVTMSITYLPTLRFYGISWVWAPLIPVIAAFYLAMTWTSAIRYWKGERVRWRGRIGYLQTP